MRFDVNLLAYCGLYCDQCSARTAFVEQNDIHLEKYPTKVKRDGSPMTAFDCDGCKGNNRCGQCDIKECASGKELDSCAECGEFPCAILEEFGSDEFPHHRQAVENLRVIKEIGVEAWFETKLRPALRCHCGERQSWYYVCPQHG